MELIILVQYTYSYRIKKMNFTMAIHYRTDSFHAANDMLQRALLSIIKSVVQSFLCPINVPFSVDFCQLWTYFVV